MSDEKAKAKTIFLLLNDGNLNGVISLEASSWNSGALYAAPRDRIDELLENEAVKNFGVYLLLSEEKVYIGQSHDLSKRIQQHLIGKDWWQTVVVLTTTDNKLTRSDIDYLEAKFISMAKKAGRLESENRQDGNAINVTRFQEVVLEQYIEEAVFMMRLIGVNIFDKPVNKPAGPVKLPPRKHQKNPEKNETHELVPHININTNKVNGAQDKKDAINFLNKNGISIPKKNFTYAKRQGDRGYYWANPNPDLLNDDWYIILNDNLKFKLTVLKIPKGEINIARTSDQKGLHFRHDKVDKRLDLRIRCDSLTDMASGANFSEFVVSTLSY